MANIKSAKKRIRQSAGRRARNKTARSRLRTSIKKHRSADAKSETLPATYSEIDVARKKGAIHRNAAARYKSRLAKAAGKSKV